MTDTTPRPDTVHALLADGTTVEIRPALRHGGHRHGCRWPQDAVPEGRSHDEGMSAPRPAERCDAFRAPLTSHHAGTAASRPGNKVTVVRPGDGPG